MTDLSKYYSEAVLRINNIAGNIDIYVDVDIAQHFLVGDVIEIFSDENDFDVDDMKPTIPQWVKRANLYYDDKNVNRDKISKLLLGISFIVEDRFFNHDRFLICLKPEDSEEGIIDDSIEDFITECTPIY
jgi:hypothetical protein